MREGSDRHAVGVKRDKTQAARGPDEIQKADKCYRCRSNGNQPGLGCLGGRDARGRAAEGVLDHVT